MTAAPAPPVEVREVRVLDGPNLFFTKPAVKVSLAVPGYLALDVTDAREVGRRVGLKSPRPGRPGTEQRQRYVMRLAAHVTRRVAQAVGVNRLSVRTRTGSDVEEIVVAIPWRRRGWAQAAGESLAPVLDVALTGDADRVDAAISQAGERVRQTAPGKPSAVIVPTVPVVSVTGTNGKTTTTRLIAHICMEAGRTTAWSSTSGVEVMGTTVVDGDYSGPAGAREVLSTPGLEVGVLETARGGLLLKGMGVATNDVSVVTNVSADHLGLQGIDTLDQLAEVKAIVTTVTKPGGWVVLNGEDPRVWPMRHRIKAHPWAFSLDPDAPALREALAAGGRGITVLDGEIVILKPGSDPDRLVRIVDVPVTLSGLSSVNIANALAAAAATIGVGISRSDVVQGLRTFVPDPVQNEGRLNVYSLPLEAGGSVSVMPDMAHNEASLEALLEVARGIAAPGARVHLGIGGTGDRPDDAISGLGEISGKGADHVVITGKPKYVRGRSLQEIEALIRGGLARVGVADVESYPTEMGGFHAILPLVGDGDVVAFSAHEDRAQMQAWLVEHGATVDDPRAIRRKVKAARGEHEYEAEIAALWELTDDDERLSAAVELAERNPEDPRLVYELASAYDAAGQEADAVDRYGEALAAGLKEPHRHRAQVQQASSLRNLGRPQEALALLDEVAASHPGSASVAAFRALTLVDIGASQQAVADLVEALVEHAADEDTTSYRGALRRYAGALRR